MNLHKHIQRALKKMMGFEPSNIKNNQGNIKFFAQYELTNEELTEEFNYQFNNKLFKVFFCFGDNYKLDYQ